MPSIPFIGETLSLVTAAIWALAVTLFRKSGETVHPLALNAFKNLLAIVLLVPTIWVAGQALWLPTPARAYLLLFLSGIVGIGLGDTLFFQSLNRLGAGLTGIVVCLYSPFIITLSYIFLDEQLSGIQLAGALLILVAVLLTSLHRRSDSTVSPRILPGIIYGVAASAAMAAGVVIMKPLLGTHPVIWVALIRLAGGMTMLAVILLFHPARSTILISSISTKNWHYTLGGSLLGAYVSMIMWIAGMKYTQASTASALNQTNTIFIFIFAGLILKEPITARRAIGVCLAFIGAALVSFCR
ncbi:DMT family transporter [candidate division WOR-3 bacterium]|nr:DMT family transporter [candidate division WOR-3 bacterium]